MTKMQHLKNKQLTQGFTFVELIIVMVIFSLLLTIAIPAYTNYILRAHRTDAQSALALDQTIIERCYAQNFSYSAACTARPAYPHNSQQGFYSISISNLTATTFTLTATAIGEQTKDLTCTTFSVNQANQKTAANNSGTAQTVCWVL